MQLLQSTLGKRIESRRSRNHPTTARRSRRVRSTACGTDELSKSTKVPGPGVTCGRGQHGWELTPAASHAAARWHQISETTVAELELRAPQHHLLLIDLLRRPSKVGYGYYAAHVALHAVGTLEHAKLPPISGAPIVGREVEQEGDGAAHGRRLDRG